ncbi:ABC transporter permease (plasmid) [Haloferax mediterranei ATCC 33500]|uniref:ABC transporter permease n=2 Tax=Haloferax mediterranei (strain ATCC 33500 / DSM 1411 / JCM 8866 / NBRC 14739 / NCIMB 2177 / R-4) TaxID=523841 RepID=I3RA39_HALMT|nr:nickel ABC transporter permease [Haloferax mediterranei]AFK21099.1 ABC-type dipeptide/oligopeptide/nickel transport systems, permease protein [Haloferax mediterranei ATCC 33500]AHZ24313.1 glutathione ABC transporter permease [Haloferax mediterranei ATCC 33500]MDX5989803.1 nickel ABC transporter permease [Haloferax mediterranei ATCC 33500]QCQ77247.1 ABC transporter permease [Haloferax mediterranei ATCC 33500]
MNSQYLLRRLLAMGVVLLGVSLLTYGMIFITPGDPARTILTQQMGGQTPSPEAVEQFRAANGLDDPFPVQYARWMGGVVQGDFGQSYYSDQSVTAMIVQRLPNTIELAVASMLVAIAIAVPAGIASAVNPGSRTDYAAQFGALLGVSMPNFWLGFLLIIVCSLWLDIFPVAGAGGFEYLVLPALTLGSGMAAVITRLVRTAMLDALDAAYIRTARSKGLLERIVVYKHAFRNALVPVVTVIGLQLSYVLNGAVVVEVVFQRPGLGTLLVDAIFARDYPIVQGVTLLVGVIFVVTNFAVDLTYRRLDPRIDHRSEPA